jgi:DNA-binding transcriptional LysR family regulator
MPLLRNAALLRDFLAVAGTGGVSAAAQTLGVSQPALTKSIRRLEAHYGLALFERRARGMALTPFGETLLAHAKLIDAQCRFADAEMQAFTQGGGGRLRIGAGPFWGATVVPLAIVRLQQQLPRLEIELDVGVNTVIHPRLFAGDLDIVVCALPDTGPLPPAIEVHRFFDLTMRVIAGDHHPLVKRRRVSAADLAPYPWALYQRDREIVDKLLAALHADGGAPPRVMVESSSVLAVLEMLKSGPYLSCIADAFLRVRPDSGVRAVAFHRDIWSCPSGALYHRTLRQFAPVHALIDAIDDISTRIARSPKLARSRAVAHGNAISSAAEPTPIA